MKADLSQLTCILRILVPVRSTLTGCPSPVGVSSDVACCADVPVSVPAGKSENVLLPSNDAPDTADIIYDETAEGNGIESFAAIAGALDMFRKK